MSRSVALILAPSQTLFSDPNLLRHSPPPLTLAVLQGHLRSHGFTVHATDLNAHLADLLDQPGDRWWQPLFEKDRVLDYLRNGVPVGLEHILRPLLDASRVDGADVIGVSTGTSMSLFEIHTALVLARALRDHTGLPVVLGGANLDYLWQFRTAFRELWDAMLHAFRYLFAGPAERSFADLVRGFDRPSEETSFQNLPGAIYSRDGELRRNPDPLPTPTRPDFDGLDIGHYTLCTRAGLPASESTEANLVHFYRWPNSLAPVVSAENRRTLPESQRRETLFIPYIFNHQCPYHCAFCVQSGRDERPAPARSAASVVADIEALTSRHDTPYLRLFNNAVNFSVPFLRQFCELMVARGSTCYWSDCARFDTLTEDLIDLMYRAGCRKLVFGLDSASERILQIIDKRLHLGHARDVLRWCHERGIWAEAEVIVGLPHETEDDFQQTYTFIADNLDAEHLTGFHLNRYFVIPSSLFGRYPERYGIRLHKAENGYQEALRHGAETLSVLVDPAASLARLTAHQYHLWTYSEVGGRTADQIAEETDDKYRRMARLAAPRAGRRRQLT